MRGDRPTSNLLDARMPTRMSTIIVRTLSGGFPMKAYVMTSGAIFALVAIAHVLRVTAEGAHLAGEPFFVLTTLASVGMSVWAWRVLPTS